MHSHELIIDRNFVFIIVNKAMDGIQLLGNKKWKLCWPKSKNIKKKNLKILIVE